MLEHGAYTLILDAYYDREQPLSTNEAMRVCRARSEEEREAVVLVLQEFFTCIDGLWVQKRVEEELANAAQLAENARKNGKKGGRPRKQKHNPVGFSENPGGFNSKPSGNPDVTQTKANPLIHKSTNPLEDSLPREDLPPRLKVTTGGLG